MPESASIRADDFQRTRPRSSKVGYFCPLNSLYSSLTYTPHTRMGNNESVSRVHNKASTQLPPRSFSFRQRRGKIDSRAIAQIDLNRVVRETDIDTIQCQLENLAFSDVTLQDFNQYSDEYFLKLFQVAQLTVEYLLSVQESLVAHSQDLERQCGEVRTECKMLADENDKIDSEVCLLKQDIKQKQNTISTYEMMLLTQQYKSTPPPRSTSPDTPVSPALCILCNKKFLSTEYLLKHQKKKHVEEAMHTQESKTSFVVQTEAMKEHEVEDTVIVSKPEVVEGPDINVVNALISANTTILTKQIENVQAQLVHDKAERHQETQFIQQQHQSFAEKVVDHMSRMQEALKDMQLQSQSQREEWKLFTQGILNKLEKARVDHIGPIVNDAEENWRREVFQEVKAQKDEEKKRRLELEAERKLWSERESKLLKQLEIRENSTHPTLTEVMAMEAQKYGIDYGLASPRSLADSQIQTELDVKDSQQKTDDEKSAVILVKKESTDKIAKVPTLKSGSTWATIESEQLEEPSVQKVPSVKDFVKSSSEIQKTNEVPPIDLPSKSVRVTLSPTSNPQTSQPQRSQKISSVRDAATKLQKMATGYMTRKHLNKPENWILRYGKNVSVSVAHDMTANTLRRTLAERLGNIDPHRIVVHDMLSGKELVGDMLVFDANGNLEIEVISNNDPGVDSLRGHHKMRTEHVQRLKHTTPSSVHFDDHVLEQIVRFQAHIRGVLGRRFAMEKKIDRLVEVRLKNLSSQKTLEPNTILHSPRESSRALQLQTEKVQERLKNAVADFHGGPKTQNTLNQTAFELSMRNLQENRSRHPPLVQARIADMMTTIHEAAMKNYDPQLAKVHEMQTDAAVSIQSIVRATLAKKVFSQLAKKKHAPEPLEGKKSQSQVSSAHDDVKDENKAVKKDDEAMTIEEFNEGKVNAPQNGTEAAPMHSIAEMKEEYNEEKEKLRAIKDDDESSPSRISPFSNTSLQSMKRRNSRGTMMHNAR
ncbi:Aste57867_18047 [Aphanomyces stellatus]|uniref:Aste57867_18047 protein n=1 Tax=Aphanomyces stellatus TaxID=120398 RepID=A0A485LAG3_9STRA|nr:hypothetical protein As57867_017985 [Aphanomyces stellatus]VFT94786.1 Aste57867_18047 [Aphanomyces stellatus]